MQLEVQDSRTRCTIPLALAQDYKLPLAIWPQDDTGLQPAPWEPSLRTLAGGVAHKFNNLLTVILGSATLIRQQLPADSAVHGLVDLIETAGANGEGITRQMLLYSRHTKVGIEPLDLAIAIQYLDPHFRANMPERVALEYELDAGMPAVLADPSHLRRLILSLFANATEAIGDGPGRIGLRTESIGSDQLFQLLPRLQTSLAQGQYAWLQISDTGCGIDDDAAQRIFEPFFSTKFAGRGLGLSMAFGIVRRHQGTIWLTTKPGRGTTAHVLLPCA